MEMYINVKKACGPRPEKANRRRRVQMRPQTTVHGQKPEFARVLLGALTGRRTGATAGDGRALLSPGRMERVRSTEKGDVEDQAFAN